MYNTKHSELMWFKKNIVDTWTSHETLPLKNFSNNFSTPLNKYGNTRVDT